MSTRVIEDSSKPLISVIIPTYNRAHTLARAVDSVLSQTFQDFELLVIDDGSTDATNIYLNGLMANSASAPRRWPIRLLKIQSNSGVSSARNLGIENSRGEWLAFLDSDDEWLPEKLELQMDFVLNHGKVFRLVHGEEIWIRNGVRVNQMNKHQKSGGRIFKRCVDLCCISPSAVLINRSLFADVGLFREDFVVCEDYELWLRVAALEDVGFIDRPLIKKYGGHDDQLSRSSIGMDLWRLRALLPFVKEDFVRQDYYSFKNQLSVAKPQVRDLLGGSTNENEEFAMLTEDERTYAMAAVLMRMEILRKGAEKHGNIEMLAELDKISAGLH